MGKAAMIGQKLGSFKIESLLGTGAMGVVYKGVSESNGRAVAIKVVTGEIAQKGNAYERFKRESEILQQFRHPNIVRFLAVGRYQGTSYFAMEYIPGATLDTLLEKRGYLPWQEVVHLGIQICDALHYAHQHGVVHRDLKPSNLMISDKGEVKLTDFGIAKDLDATALTATGRTLGTAAYMAPEQIRGTPEVSHKTDLYALGVVLYEMLAGESPFQGPTAIVMMHRHLTDEPPRPSSKLTDIPLELDKLVVRLMAKEPADRPWDAAAVGMVLSELRDAVSRGEAIPMVWPSTVGPDGTLIYDTPPKKPRKRKKKSRYTVETPPWIQTGLLVLALVVVLGVFAYMLWPPSAGYLYHKAEALMASTEMADWIRARDDYLDDLDSRFPEHPYRKQTDQWRDRILFQQADRRAAKIDAKGLGSISKPQNEVEKTYASASDAAAEASKNFDDQAAVASWQAFAKTLEPKERGWLILARNRASALEEKMNERRQDLLTLLDRAGAAERAGRDAEARAIRINVLRKYGAYQDLREWTAPLSAALNPPPAPPVDEPVPKEEKPPAEGAALPPAAPPPN